MIQAVIRMGFETTYLDYQAHSVHLKEISGCLKLNAEALAKEKESLAVALKTREHAETEAKAAIKEVAQLQLALASVSLLLEDIACSIMFHPFSICIQLKESNEELEEDLRLSEQLVQSSKSRAKYIKYVYICLVVIGNFLY